jgi:hypothetical protein
VSLIISSSNFELKGFNAHVGNLSSPHARRRLIGCANFKGYGCIEEVKGHVDGRGQDEDLFTLLVNSVGK